MGLRSLIGKLSGLLYLAQRIGRDFGQSPCPRRQWTIPFISTAKPMVSNTAFRSGKLTNSVVTTQGLLANPTFLPSYDDLTVPFDRTIPGSTGVIPVYAYGKHGTMYTMYRDYPRR